LTANKVSIEIIALEDEGGTLVRKRVRVFIKLRVDWAQTNEGSLSSFYHRQPNDGYKENDQGNNGMRILRESGLLVENESDDEDNTKEKQDTRVAILEHLYGSIGTDHDYCVVL